MISRSMDHDLISTESTQNYQIQMFSVAFVLVLAYAALFMRGTNGQPALQATFSFKIANASDVSSAVVAISSVNASTRASAR
jgi:hypothetical protein